MRHRKYRTINAFGMPALCAMLALPLAACGADPPANTAMAVTAQAREAAAQELNAGSDLGVAFLEPMPDGLSEDVEGWDYMDVTGADGEAAIWARFSPAHDCRAQREVDIVVPAEGAEIFGLATGGSSDGVAEAMAARGFEEEPSEMPYCRLYRKAGVHIAFFLDAQAGTIWRFYIFFLSPSNGYFRSPDDLFFGYKLKREDYPEESIQAAVQEIRQGCNFKMPLLQHSSHGWPTDLEAFTAGYDPKDNAAMPASALAYALMDGNGTVYGVCYYYLCIYYHSIGTVASHVVLEAGGHVFGVGIGDTLADARAAMAAYRYAEGETVFPSEEHALSAQSELEAAGYSAAIFHKDGINIAFLASPGQDRITKILVWASEISP
ncbi:MAG: hypothetical protein LBR44_10135 [Clostridiales Family XIII bacterium]|jgi:hypothetical protein|nr:hypothetical protein [Clostridiales Family XIII bacterium]